MLQTERNVELLAGPKQVDIVPRFGKRLSALFCHGLLPATASTARVVKTASDS
jgi:hypothetical protein